MNESLRRSAAVLLALLIAAVALWGLPRSPAHADDEGCDMLAYAYNRWIKFNSSDPSQWVQCVNHATTFGSDRISAAAMLHGKIYASNYNGNANIFPHYLGVLNEEFEVERSIPLSIPKLGLPMDIGDGVISNYPLITAMCYCEADDCLYALAAYYDYLETDDTAWTIARVNEENGELDPVCTWYTAQTHSVANPFSFAALNDGTFAVIDGLHNTLIIVEPADPYNSRTVCELPVLASNLPNGYYIYPPMPQSMYYNSADNTVLWGACKQYYIDEPASYLVKIDLTDGEVIYCEDIRGAGGMMGWMLWPLNCFIPLSETQSGLPGDANGDGEVDIADALLALRCAMGLTEAVPAPENADLDGDGEITAADAVLILRLAMGLV